MPRWEYNVKELFGPWTTESVEEEEAIRATRDHLNRLGREGWDLVSVISRTDPESRISDYYMILKRSAPQG
ncbi:MAG: hypothetical protein ACE5JS_01645 [Nitrospinota bacterium]